MNRVSPGAAWTIVALLCVFNALSYLDRYIVALLAQPIMSDLAVDATRIGLLIGLGFGLLYAISAPPVAHFLDTRNRVRYVGLGVFLWSASTVASAFAQTYEILMLTRAGVAIGEAVLLPATVSLISDLFSAEKRALPVGLFMGVATLMSGGSFLIGGATFAAAEQIGPTLSVAPWRLTLMAVGAPGAVLALLWLLSVREPARQSAEAKAATVGETIQHLRKHAAFFVPFFTAFAASATSIYGFISWIATVLTRSFDLSVVEAGSLYGAMSMTGAAIAAVFWPALGGFNISKGRDRWNIVALAAGLAFGHGVLACILFAPTLPIALGLVVCTAFGHSTTAALAVLVIQGVAPPSMRARISSLYILFANVVGLTLGPIVVPWIADRFFAGDDALRTSLSLVAAFAAPASAGLFLLSLRAFGKAHAAARVGETSQPAGAEGLH